MYPDVRQGGAVDNYIIRIYRRDPSDPRRIVGTAESVERDEKRNFTDFDQLREFIGTGKTGEDSGQPPRKTTKRGRKP